MSSRSLRTASRSWKVFFFIFRRLSPTLPLSLFSAPCSASSSRFSPFPSSLPPLRHLLMALALAVKSLPLFPFLSLPNFFFVALYQPLRHAPQSDGPVCVLAFFSLRYWSFLCSFCCEYSWSTLTPFFLFLSPRLALRTRCWCMCSCTFFVLRCRRFTGRGLCLCGRSETSV